MTVAEKADAQEFRDHLANLKKATWLGTARRWWPDFLFHHTNVENVVQILKSGYIYSRSELNSRGQNFHDSASPDVIAQTHDQWKDYVRFYFRPQTPTFFHIESFRPKNRQEYSAQCPIPVYLLFDLPSVLCRADSMFSRETLASSSTSVYSSAEAFKKMPFFDIYHNEPLPSDGRKSTIKRRRHAEVIVPKRIDLDCLKRIWCRSRAEYDTLHYLLGDKLWSKWKDKITDRTDHSLFWRYWIHITSAELELTEIVLKFNPCDKTQDAGPFSVQLQIKEIATGSTYSWQEESWTLDKSNRLIFNIKNLKRPENYTVKFLIDNHIAYANEYTYEPEDIPF